MNFRLGMTTHVICTASLYFPLNRKLTGGFNFFHMAGRQDSTLARVGHSLSAVPARVGSWINLGCLENG
ncbi:MAG: hypothetical protein ACYC6R_10870 [Anaerolineales bacterium]